MKLRVFKCGQKIILKANPAEGWEREEATVEGFPGDEIIFDLDQDLNALLIVGVKTTKEDPDGLREVSLDQIEESL